MSTITCEYCGNRFDIANPQDLPKDCPNCNQPLENVQLQDVSQPQTRQTSKGLTFTYAKTNESVTFMHANELILGREALGKDLFEKIGYISRRHCRIEVLDNRYCVTDLNSSNGTFIGESKIDCKLNPRQVLHHGDILMLGREPFRVKIHAAAPSRGRRD